MYTKTESGKRIEQIQGLRAIAFLAVFTEHAGWTHLGAWGVSCFIILSGFLMYKKYGNSVQNKKISIGNLITSAINRIKKLYWLHLLTFFTAAFVYYENFKFDSIKHSMIVVFKAISNLLLLQTLFPKSEFYWSFNAVSWYYSLAFVLYLLFPVIAKKIDRMRTLKQMVVSIIGIYTLQAFVSSVLLVLRPITDSIPVVISDNLNFYLTYICPFYRLGDFAAGCILGRIILLKHKKELRHSFWLHSIMEVTVWLSLIILQEIYNGRWGLIIAEDEFRNDLLYSVNILVIIYLTVKGSGLVSKHILANRLLVDMGNISGYAFFSHQLVIVCLRKCGFGKLLVTTCGLVITVVLSYGFMHFACNKKLILGERLND